MPSPLRFSGLEGQTGAMVVMSDKNPFKALMDQKKAVVVAAVSPSVMDDGGIFSYMPSSLDISGLEGQTDDMVLSDKNPFKTLMDQKKVQGLNKERYELGMKVWLQTQMGTQRVGHLARLTGSVPLAEEVAAAACPPVVDDGGVFSYMPSSLDISGLEGQTGAMVLSERNPFKALMDQEKVAVAAAGCPRVVDDGWTSFMFSMIRRMVSEENGRAELWAAVLQLKEQALVQEAQAKLDLLSCQPRCGEGSFMESIHVISQLTHQQAQMTMLGVATQAASEDRKLLLKHLADIETQRAATIQLQQQAEAYRKEAQLPEISVLQPGLMQRQDLKAPETKLVSPAASAPDQDTKALHSEVQDAEDLTFGEDLSLKVAMGEQQEMGDKTSYENDKYEEVSTKCPRDGTLRTPQCAVASHDAAAMLDEGEVEDEADTCSSLSSSTDCGEFLLTDVAVSGAEETLGHNPLREETPRGSVRSDPQALEKLNRDDQTGTSDVSAQDRASWSRKAGKAWSKFQKKFGRKR